MSVRIYTLSKEIGIPNNELIDLLRERGFDIKSASSTIDNISADSLIEEFSTGSSSDASPVEEASPEPIAEAPAKEEPARPKLPVGAIVRSKEEVDEERRKKEEEKRATVERPAPKPGQIGAPTPIAAPVAPPRPLTPAPPQGKAAPMIPPVKSAPVPPPIAPAPPVAAAGTPPPPPPAPKPKAEDVEKPETVSSDKEDSGESIPEEDKIIIIKPPIVVRDFAALIGLKPFKLISELMELGIFASMNQAIEEPIAEKIAIAHGYMLDIKHRGEGNAKDSKKPEQKIDESKLLEPRPPVVCIMGHVDHGKTTLLDTIRKANVAAGEAGGITQHVGAYQIEHNGNTISFIDTPGHAAFSRMRMRGAHITDIVVLVVAADDGFKPQTDEALKSAQKAGVPIMVAINKMDAKGANADKVRQQMQERGIAPEDWGGETITEEISALKGDGIDSLLDSILLQAEIMELKANPKCPAEGVILEAQLETGLGSVATMFIQKGTLKTGDAILADATYCRVRAILDDRGNRLKSATPGTSVRVLGWSETPPAGGTFAVLKNEREAKRAAEDILHAQKMRNAEAPVAEQPQGVEDLFAAIEGAQKATLRLVVKADMQGALEAMLDTLDEIESDKVNLEVIGSGIGAVTKKDIMLASTAGAGVVAFNVKQENGVANIAKHEGVIIYQQSIIYEVIDIIKDALADLLEPEIREVKTGGAEVRQVFPVSRGKIAGCMVVEGTLRRDAVCRVSRGGEVIHEGKIGMIRRFKDDVTEVRAGYECGIRIEKFDGIEEGDMIEAFTIEKIKPTL